jgi:hypothetical protein
MNASTAESIENLKAFFGRFDGVRQQEQERYGTIQPFLDEFKNEWTQLQKDEEIWGIQTAPHFNIFRVLNIQRREVKLHSRFIAELLKPLGSHGQQDHFLNLFFKATGLRRPKIWPDKFSDWKITTEEVTANSGRLDIVLRAPGFIIVIENKIDAGEQEEQMLRYKKWLKEQEAKFPYQYLIFLTPDGKSPTTISENQCVCLSYCEHIQNWLEQALQGIKAPMLNSTITQYLQIVKSLRN